MLRPMVIKALPLRLIGHNINLIKNKNDMKIALIGYGKMGKEIERIARSRGHEIVSIIDVNNTEDFDSPAFRSGRWP